MNFQVRRVIFFLISMLIRLRSISSMATFTNSSQSRINNLAYFDAIASAKHIPPLYRPIPPQYKLDKVVIIHRHGDRSQISHSLGTNLPKSDETTLAWSKKLPSNETLISLAKIARKSDNDEHHFDTIENVKEYLYNGWDKDNVPYGQLTTDGVNQMKTLGTVLGERYLNYFSDNFNYSDLSNEFLLRSTDSCRTVQSLRSFMLGFLASITDTSSQSVMVKKPIIRTRSKSLETMFPMAGAPCEAISKRRSVITTKTPITHSMPDYNELEAKMKSILGYTDHVPWISVKEVITCRLVHELSLPPGITIEDDEKLTYLTSWLWAQLFNDKILNRLSIGRFVHEFLDDLSKSYEISNSNSCSNPEDIGAIKSPGAKVIVYSGHDSTLVPLLCAFEVYDGKWPPYASYLAFEIVKGNDEQIFVRGIFNDETRNLFGLEEWISFDTFTTILKKVSMSPEEYELACKCLDHDNEESVASEQALDESRKEMAEEINATLGGAEKTEEASNGV